MSTLKCLACEHVNEAGAPFCGACGSSLNLRLCPSCEAINNPAATHCHSCAAELPAQAAEAPSQASEPLEPAIEQQPFRAPQRWRVIEADYSPVKRAAVWTARLLGAFALVAVGAAGYHFYGHWLPNLQAAVAVPVPTPAPAPAAAPVPVAAPDASDVPAPAPKRPVAAVKQAPKAAPVPAPRAVTAVTHLRGDAPAAAATPSVPIPEEKPVVEAPVLEEKQILPDAPVRTSRVTHTQPGAGVVTGEATPAPAAASLTVSAPAAPRKETAGKCAEAVAVLGLCNPIVQGRN